MFSTEICVFAAHKNRNVSNNFSAFVFIATQISDWFDGIWIFFSSTACSFCRLLCFADVF